MTLDLGRYFWFSWRIW